MRNRRIRLIQAWGNYCIFRTNTGIAYCKFLQSSIQCRIYSLSLWCVRARARARSYDALISSLRTLATRWNECPCECVSAACVLPRFAERVAALYGSLWRGEEGGWAEGSHSRTLSHTHKDFSALRASSLPTVSSILSAPFGDWRAHSFLHVSRLNTSVRLCLSWNVP